jgi:hypothetical protein
VQCTVVSQIHYCIEIHPCLMGLERFSYGRGRSRPHLNVLLHPCIHIVLTMYSEAIACWLFKAVSSAGSYDSALTVHSHCACLLCHAFTSCQHPTVLIHPPDALRTADACAINWRMLSRLGTEPRGSWRLTSCEQYCPTAVWIMNAHSTLYQQCASCLLCGC